MSEKSYTIVFIISLFFISFEALAQNTQTLQAELKVFSEDQNLKNASWGFIAINTTDGDVLAAHNPDLALVPASVQKVLTTITALDVMGSDHQFQTELLYSGEISDLQLLGNLVIKGSGDPSLGSSLLHDSLSLEKVFDTWFEEIEMKGITRILGDIVTDGSVFDDFMVPSKWMWEDLGNYYGAGAHGLTVMENEYRVVFNPGARVGDSAKVLGTQPMVYDMEFVNDVKTGPARSGDKVYIYGAPYQNVRWLTGTVPLGENDFAVRGSLPDPGYYLGKAFYEYLKDKGIDITGSVVTHKKHPSYINAKDLNRISVWRSPHLSSICERTNMHSVNTYAENLIKILGSKYNDQGSFVNGAEVIRDFWKDKGMDVNGLNILDGSGLSPVNTITPRQMAFVLNYASQNKDLLHALLPGLPVAGSSGSLSRMFLNTRSQNVLTAKSGFLSHVRSYAGYTHCKNGKRIAFVFIVNHYEGAPLQMRRKMETLMNALSESAL